MTQVKSCRTCVHRTWDGRCERVGWFCKVELMFGGNCCRVGELRLWQRRPTLAEKVLSFFGLSKAEGGEP